MVINTDKLREFERSEIARKDITYEDALAIFEALRQEAVSLGAFSCENILDGLEDVIKLAKAIHSLKG